MRALALCVLALVATLPPAAGAFVAFETGQVRPLALSPDGERLLALNTPDGRLEVFAVDAAGLTQVASLPVGLEPVAVAWRSDTEAWVVNHLSDSVSIVDLGVTPPRVVRTLLVGDEPRDVVFAGPKDGAGRFTRAFITTARLGQNLPASIPPLLTTPGVPRALVWVFDATDLGPTLGGSPETIIELFGDTPRALAATPDGATVYAAVFMSGNQTTTVTEGAVCNGGAGAADCAIDGVQIAGGLAAGRAPGGLPAPNDDIDGVAAPEVGLIVRRNPTTGVWQDELGRNWNNAVRFDLPDRDVFRIDALANPPVQTAAIAHVGTVLFNMAVHPTTGALFVTNSEAGNEVRFEGSGERGTSLRGDLHRSRITIVDGSSVRPRHLNKHILAQPQGYRTHPMPPAVKQASLSTPLDLAISSQGTVYVAGFGSDAVGVYEAASLVDDSFTPDPSRLIRLSGGGPSGLALDEARGRLYVLTRFDNALKVVDLGSGAEIAQRPLFNPEPPKVIDGRRFLYDALLTSSNGETSCAVCHVFGDIDQLAWDLGNPDEHTVDSFNPLGPTGLHLPFHPMKGPMTTQTLRGMKHQGPMHWRGDRSASTFFGDPRALDADLAFKLFNPTFDFLMGREEGELSDEEMQAFTDFMLEVQAPPNPVRALDNQLTPAQAQGRALFVDRRLLSDTASHCAGCHTLNAGDGNFGTLGQSAFSDEPQQFKVPQLKNMYQKVGMFGMPKVPFADIPASAAEHQGEQIRGFGFLHDGSVDTMFHFLRSTVFVEDAVTPLSDDQRRDIEQFLFAFDTTYAPIVGQQVTLAADTAATAGPRLDLMIARAQAPFVVVDRSDTRECELVARVTADARTRGYLFNPATGVFQSDRREEVLSDASLRALAASEPVTYTCAPPGEGRRLGLDRDDDGVYDQDEIDDGSDPLDPRDPFLETPTPSPTITRTPTPSRTPTRTPGELPGDADCNHELNTGDVRAAATSIFNRRAAAQCNADCTADGKVTAADLTCIVVLLGAEPH